MNRAFDVDGFIARIGKRLVDQYDDARTATSPTTIGAALEQPVRHQLEQILPRGIAVGSGFIIDSFGGTSRQQDVVLYEEDICPVFSVNNTPETTYYPSEGVIAVGEVKTSLNRSTLEDAFKKIASVKKLQRFVVYHPVPLRSGERIVEDRRYGSLHRDSLEDVSVAKEQALEAHILGFVLSGELQLQPDTFCDVFQELAHDTGDVLSPNIVTLLTGGIITWGNLTKERKREIKISDQTKGYVLEEKTGNRTVWDPTWSARKASFFSIPRYRIHFAH